VNPTTRRYDAVVIGGGVMGCSAALHLARGGMRVAVIDRGPLCREASGVNAGTLTLHMTRAALIPYAMRAWKMWMEAEQWLGMGVLATHVPGLTLAFTEGECELVELRAKARREYGAPIEVISPERAREIEPGVHPALLKAGYCEIDGFASAYLTGRAFRHALARAGVDVWRTGRCRPSIPATTAMPCASPAPTARACCTARAWCSPAASGSRTCWPGSACPFRSRC
jgi:sarcosine oxidase subunit beta